MLISNLVKKPKNVYLKMLKPNQFKEMSKNGKTPNFLICMQWQLAVDKSIVPNCGIKSTLA
jgi:hypothetical protein